MERRPGVKYKWGGEGELLSGGEADAKNNSVNARGRVCVCVCAHSKGNCRGS